MRAGGRAGFTLVEVLVSLTLLSVVLGAAVAVMLGVQRGYIRQRETARAETALRTAEATILGVLRAAGADPRDTRLTLLDPDKRNHGVFDNVRVVSDFNPPDGDVTDLLEDVLVYVERDTLYVSWRAGQAATPVAAPVRTLRFEYYASNGSLLTTKALVSGATRVKVLLAAPRHSRTKALARRESWVYLRNRR
jgi:prepilin-type N-terminal cleavage/methylation domain-containing protein